LSCSSAVGVYYQALDRWDNILDLLHDARFALCDAFLVATKSTAMGSKPISSVRPHFTLSGNVHKKESSSVGGSMRLKVTDSFNDLPNEATTTILTFRNNCGSQSSCQQIFTHAIIIRVVRRQMT
jgi:hypothetical protein